MNAHNFTLNFIVHNSLIFLNFRISHLHSQIVQIICPHGYIFITLTHLLSQSCSQSIGITTTGIWLFNIALMLSKQTNSSSKLRPFNADNDHNHNNLKQRLVTFQSLWQYYSIFIKQFDYYISSHNMCQGRQDYQYNNALEISSKCLLISPSPTLLARRGRR